MLNVLSFFFSIAIVSSATASCSIIDSVTVLTEEVPRHGKFEASVSLQREYEDPFDPNVILLRGTFISPSRKKFSVEGFLFQDFERHEENGREILSAKGNREWRVRFCPTEPGLWKFKATAIDNTGRDESSVHTFSCLVSGNTKEFIRVSNRNPNYFEFDSGDPYFAVGENLCWSASGRGTRDYDDWFGRLSENGVNYARLFIGPFTLFTIERKKNHPEDQGGGIGRYDLANAWNLDYVLEAAEKNGIYLMMCLESYNSLLIGPAYPFWKENPYSVDNGGFLSKPEDFFTDEEAQKRARNRYRYIVSRYGYSTHILSWELWNEVDIIEKYISPDVRKWHDRMARYLRSIDPYHHLITTSFAKDPADASIDGLKRIDYVQTHNYGSEDVAETLSSFCLQKSKRFDKPHYMGEFGLDWQGKNNDSDPTGIHLHNGLWAPVMSMSAGTGMLWWWDGYVHPNNLYHHFSPISKFVKSVDWPAHRWRPIEVESIELATPRAFQPPDDILLIPKAASWEPAPFNKPGIFKIERNGKISMPERLSQILHGKVNHRDLHNPATFEVDYPANGKFIVRVEKVSGFGGGFLVVSIDGAEVLSKNFAGSEPPGEPRERVDLNGDFGVDVPSGKHSIRVENNGVDWICVSYELVGCRIPTEPNLRVLGITDKRQALLWIQNRDNTWHRCALGKQPREVPPSRITLSAMKTGEFTAEWWDTYTGEIISRQPVSSSHGRFILSTPAIKLDVACKIY